MRTHRLLLSALLLALLSSLGLAQAEPQGIIVEPPIDDGLQVEIWLDNASYLIGETIQINYRINHEAYIYVWSIDARGNVTQLFPNQFSSDNRVAAGTHVLPAPGAGYQLRVTPPTGTDYLQIMATREADPQAFGLLGSFSAVIPFPQLAEDPQEFKAQLEAQLQGVEPEPADRAFASTRFQVVTTPQAQFGRLEINTSPSSAEVLIDGVLMGYSPLSLSLAAGQHSLTLQRTGYRTFSSTVTIQAGGTERVDVMLTPETTNVPPVAQFSYQPSQPLARERVRFDASGSYDPDGAISSYRWDLDGDGTFDASGRTASWAYTSPGAYSVTLQVRDNLGAATRTTRTVIISSSLTPAWPPVGTTAGIYVWGTDNWNLTVVGSPEWTTDRRYRLELKTDGEFVPKETASGPQPMGIMPEPVDEGWRIVYEGQVTSNQVTHTFQLRNASSMRMELSLDRDGDGRLDQRPGMTYLREFQVNPPNVPFVVGVPQGYEGELTPTLNFRLGQALSYTQNARFVFYHTTIEALEAR